eukprot:gnl/Spiro4/13985_TR7493_c0_g1_i1.p1 gnl/Spiro4/13985_TR7493_c0_g1~~gnl/Spiro4/13985_TR7493_c0_g1_i1.p1  ORF type:complete len:190 (+),score=44.59 gnl/Spiro4/13985_TR7493_c0_g1_i1:113-682(+)
MIGMKQRLPEKAYSGVITRNDPDDNIGMDGLTGLLGALVVTYLVAMMWWLFLSYPVWEWYPYLRRPSWALPPWLFFPFVLFFLTMQAFSMWMCVVEGGLKRHAMTAGFFAAQLACGIMWCGFFFGARLLYVAVFWAAVWWVFALCTQIEMWANDDGREPLAGWVFLPSLAAVSYIFCLSLTLAVLNPGG